MANSRVQQFTDFIRQILTKRYLAIIGMAFIVFLLSGGLYVIVNRPPAEVETSSGGSSFLITGGSLAGQTSSELLVAFFLIIAGAIGFILLERSFRKSFDLNDLKIKYLVGFMLIVIAIGLMEYLTYVKI